MGSGAVAPEVIQTADQLIQVHTQTKWLVFVPLITQKKVTCQCQALHVKSKTLCTRDRTVLLEGRELSSNYYYINGIIKTSWKIQLASVINLIQNTANISSAIMQLFIIASLFCVYTVQVCVFTSREQIRCPHWEFSFLFCIQDCSSC